MAKLEVDFSNLNNLEQLFDDIISNYDRVINNSKNTYIPYDFQKKYSFQENHSNILKDREALIELKKWTINSLKELHDLNDILVKQAGNLPINTIKSKDFFI